MEEFLSVLSKSLLFSGIDRQDYSAMLACLGARIVHCGRGASILREGEPARELGVVLRGSAQVSRTDYYGNRSLMARLGPADLFAEAFACAGVAAMPVSVTALEETDAMLIDAGRILHACSSACGFHQQMIHNLTRILALKNLAFSRKIEVTGQRTTREKLLTYLMLEAKQAGSNTVLIPFDRQELADYLEVDRSGLSSQIGKLRREGVLLCEKNRFTLLG